MVRSDNFLPFCVSPYGPLLLFSVVLRIKIFTPVKYGEEGPLDYLTDITVPYRCVSGTDKNVTTTNENTISSSQVINTIPDIPSVSDFIKDRLGNVFFTRLGTKFGNQKKNKKIFRYILDT